MEVYTNGNYFDIHFDYNARIISAIKKIPGKRYIPARKLWQVPVKEVESVERLVKRFGVNNKEEKPQEYGELPPMPELDPEIKATMLASLLRAPYHYQEQGIAFNLKYKRVLNGDDMGGGKTTTTIATIVAAGLHKQAGLIVCKGSGKYMWQNEFKVVAGMTSIIMTDSVKDTWPVFHRVGGCNVFITNYESLEKFFVKKISKPDDVDLGLEHITWKTDNAGTPLIDTFKYVVLDESHEIRYEDTVKSVLCVGLGIGKEWRFALSGTAIVNKSKDIYPQLNFLGRTKNTKESRREFINRYCGGGTGTKSTNSKELHYKLSLNCYFRRNTHEFGIDLPDLTLQLIYSEINNRKEYEHAKGDLYNYLVNNRGRTDKEAKKSMNAEAMVLIGVLQNISARGKLREAIEEIDNCLNTGRKIVVFLNQKQIKEALMKHYPRGLVISGDESALEKSQAEHTFNTTEEVIPIFVSIKAGGVGTNLQQDCIDELFIEFPWHPALYYQAAKRVHRNGVKDRVIAKNLLGKDTIDERIWEIIESKKQIADTILGSEDDIKQEIIDNVMGSLFNKKAA